MVIIKIAPVLTLGLPGHAERNIARYIDGFYNAFRRHCVPDNFSPAQFEKQAVR